MVEVPEIDISPLWDDDLDGAEVAASLDKACRTVGFFSVIGHGVDPLLRDRLETVARSFFALPETEKNEIAMAHAGPAWRGWFPLGGELTAGIPDEKEGLYFGTDLGADDRRVRARTPLHGPNLYPRDPEELRTLVQAYMEIMTSVGQMILSGLAIGLGLDRSWFTDHLTGEPLVLFRIFRYPPLPEMPEGRWGVGEHTDYGLLTLLSQDGSGGLQVKTSGGWVDVPARPGRIVCNIGDMLERLTGGRYRSTPHRVRNPGRIDRLSFPFFIDPSWDARVERLPIVERPTENDASTRWDQLSVHGFSGTYGEYIVSKVGRVFPDLAAGTT